MDTGILYGVLSKRECSHLPLASHYSLPIKCAEMWKKRKAFIVLLGDIPRRRCLCTECIFHPIASLRENWSQELWQSVVRTYNMCAALLRTRRAGRGPCWVYAGYTLDLLIHSRPPRLEPLCCRGHFPMQRGRGKRGGHASVTCALKVWCMNRRDQQYSFFAARTDNWGDWMKPLSDLFLTINLDGLLAHCSQRSSAGRRSFWSTFWLLIQNVYSE